MVKVLLFLTLSLLTLMLNVQAQLSTGSIVYKEKPIQQLKKYDGVSDFIYQSEPIDYNQYLGLQVYIAKPETDFIVKDISGHNYLDHKEYVSHVTLRRPSYFNISRIIFGKEMDDFFDIKDIGGARGENLEGKILVGLKSPDTSNEIFYAISKDRSEFETPFILVSYFQSQKAKYDGKEFVMVNMSGKFFDEASQETINYDKPLYGGIWRCEVNMIKTKNSNYDDMYYLLKDSIGQVILSNANTFNQAAYDICCSGLTFVKKFTDGNFYKYIYATPFMSLDDYNSELKRIKNAKALVTAKTKTYIAEEKIQRQKIIQKLTTKYGAVIAQNIILGKVKIGMNTEMCQLAWGQPYFAIISRTQDNSGTLEIWQHALTATRLYFKDNVLYKIVN